MQRCLYGGDEYIMLDNSYLGSKITLIRRRKREVISRINQAKLAFIKKRKFLHLAEPGYNSGNWECEPFFGVFFSIEVKPGCLISKRETE